MVKLTTILLIQLKLFLIVHFEKNIFDIAKAFNLISQGFCLNETNFLIEITINFLFCTVFWLD